MSTKTNTLKTSWPLAPCSWLLKTKRVWIEQSNSTEWLRKTLISQTREFGSTNTLSRLSKLQSLQTSFGRTDISLQCNALRRSWSYSSLSAWCFWSPSESYSIVRQSQCTCLSFTQIFNAAACLSTTMNKACKKLQLKSGRSIRRSLIKASVWLILATSNAFAMQRQTKVMQARKYMGAIRPRFVKTTWILNCQRSSQVTRFQCSLLSSMLSSDAWRSLQSPRLAMTLTLSLSQLLPIVFLPPSSSTLRF